MSDKKNPEISYCYPLPWNMSMKFGEFCRGCKMGDVVSAHLADGKRLFTCQYLAMCERAYELGASNGLCMYDERV